MERRQKAENHPDIQNSLLDALFAIRKEEAAVDWLVKPTVLRLDKDTLDYCYHFLRAKRKPRTVHELYLKFYTESYPMFSDDQLIHLDNRFTFTGSEAKSYDCFTISRSTKRIQELKILLK